MRRMSQVNTPMSLRDPDIERGDSPGGAAEVARGPRARMRKILLAAAVEIADRGVIPSVSDVAEAAHVSRATAYRYFPSQSVLVQSMVTDALGPIQEWTSESRDAEERVGRLIHFGYKRMQAREAALRAALRLALDQWSRTQAGTLGDEPRIVRGNRIRLLRLALAPVKRELTKRQFERLVQSLAVVFGTEAMVVLRDMFGLDRAATAEVAEWMSRVLVRAALAEATDGARTRAPRAPRADGGTAAKPARPASRRT
jgi:AcrR family transcriptional regulator